MSSYRQVLANRAARNVLLLGALVRIPFFAQSVVLALHVVQTLHGTYAQAGLLTAIVTMCVAVSGPWRGRLLDRIGLRRTVAPSIIVGGLCWMIAPFVSYTPLLTLAAMAGLFEIPIFSVVRQAVIAATSEQDRRSVLALDSVMVEMSFMVGPVLGLAAAGIWSTAAVLVAAQLFLVAGGVALLLANPPLKSREGEESRDRVPWRSWFRVEFVALCLGACAAVAVLGAEEISVVAAMRELGVQRWLGPVLALWGAGSMVGGLVYGALHRPISPYILLAGLGVSAIPCAYVGGPGSMALAAFVAGILCAPSLTASIDQVSRIVPEAGRGEAIGWHGSAMTAGTAVGNALGGLAIDAGRFPAGFALACVLGIGTAAALSLLVAGALTRSKALTLK